MQWYYAVRNQRQGPVTEAEFAQLVASGTITADTLVWRQGMADWQPWASASTAAATNAPPASESAAAPAAPATPTTAAPPAPEGAAGAPAPDDTEVCAVSGKRYPKREMIHYEGKWISAAHRDEYFQRLREGVAQPGEGTVPGPFGYGGFWRRFWAKMVDSIILSAVGMPIGALLGVGLLAPAFRGNPDSMEATVAFIKVQVAMQLIGLVLGLSYEIFFVRKFDATPGKMALGLKVLRADGTKLSIPRIIGRYFAHFVSAFILLIGYIMAAFDEEKRALHDRLCDTRVIRTR